MGYQGNEEFLCEKGHHHVIDASFFTYGGWPDDATCKHNEQDELHCNHCGGVMVWTHSVDSTNGSDPALPHTIPATLDEVGYMDVWQYDHYGNKYAVKVLEYRPAEQSTWKRIADIRAERERKEAESKARTRYYIVYRVNNEDGKFRDHYWLALNDGVWSFHSWLDDDDFDLETQGLLFDDKHEAEQYIYTNQDAIREQCRLFHVVTYNTEGVSVDVQLTFGNLLLTKAP